MLTVACVKSGSLYGPEYANRLFAMVARNLDAGTEGRFVCFTDDKTGLIPAIQVESLPANVEGWWNKLHLFSPGVFCHSERVLYLDLDTVIVGDLDKIAAWQPQEGEFAILRDFYRPDGLQSSAMMWRGGVGAHIWQGWNAAGKPELEGGDQEWIERQVRNPIILQDKFPGAFVSFKKDCIPYPPEGSSVVVFHGEPRPHNCGRPWVQSMWTESDTGHFQLKMVDNVPLEQIRKNIRHSAELGLPRLTSKPPHDRNVAIVGGGPSVNDPLSIAELSRLRSSRCEIWALNGSYDWLLSRDIIANAHVLIDARLENAAFLKTTHPETTYYIASQCSWVLFDLLKRRGRNVVRLDLDVMGDCGTTVGTHSILTAFVEGFREIHLFGFDSSYRNDEGHAYQQDLNASERIVDAHIGDKVFKSAPWMVRQAQDFEGISRDVVAAGGVITVHGDGLLPEMARILANPPLRAAQVRAQEVLRRLPDGPVYGAEIGVFRGEMSALLLARPDLTLMMVDSWEGSGKSYAEHSGDWHAGLSQDEQDVFFETADAAVRFAGKRAIVSPVRSIKAAAWVPPAVLDFVFIDADHSYEGCVADIEAWASNVKPGGLLSGHDYDNPDFPGFGVKRAVDEFAARHGHSVELGDNLTWFIRL